MKCAIIYTLASVTTLSSALAIPEPSVSTPATAAKGIKVEEIPSLFSPKNKRVRVTYGEYRLPPFNSTGGMNMGGAGGMDMGGKGMGGMDMGGKGMGGMDMGAGNAMAGMEDEGGLFDASDKAAPKPCSDCTLKYAMSYLKYPDGSVANINTGAYVHHLTMSVVGPGRVDLRCPGGTKRIPKDMERMLAFHNDRNETFYGVTATDEMGFYLGKDDKIDLEMMLKNELDIPKDVVYTIEWEYVPGRPQGYGDVHGIWVDVAPCSAMMSDLDPPKGKKVFQLVGEEWKSTINGRLLNTVGHMHDGGERVNILSNGKVVCKSEATYDGKAEYIPGPEAISRGAANMSHISSYSPCINIGQIKKGDMIGITSDYDFEKHNPARNKKGQDSDVMALAMVFVEVQK
jgi:hypothetical protein